MEENSNTEPTEQLMKLPPPVMGVKACSLKQIKKNTVACNKWQEYLVHRCRRFELGTREVSQQLISAGWQGDALVEQMTNPTQSTCNLVSIYSLYCWQLVCGLLGQASVYNLVGVFVQWNKSTLHCQDNLSLKFLNKAFGDKTVYFSWSWCCHGGISVFDCGCETFSSVSEDINMMLLT